MTAVGEEVRSDGTASGGMEIRATRSHPVGLGNENDVEDSFALM